MLVPHLHAGGEVAQDGVHQGRPPELVPQVDVTEVTTDQLGESWAKLLSLNLFISPHPPSVSPVMAAACSREREGPGAGTPGSWGEVLVAPGMNTSAEPSRHGPPARQRLHRHHCLPDIWCSCGGAEEPESQKGDRAWLRKVGARLGLRGEMGPLPDTRSVRSPSTGSVSPSSVSRHSWGRDTALPCILDSGQWTVGSGV